MTSVYSIKPIVRQVTWYDHRFIYFFAAICSILLSCYISQDQAVVNPDGICYLLSAQAIKTMGIKAAMHLCPQAIWPFYSWLIYAFVNLTHVSYQFAAYFLNGFFSLISVLTFIAIIDLLGGSKRILIYSALAILLSHEFNAVRDYIVRDHGYFAFYLLSIFSSILFMRHPRMATAILWNLSIILATLFRIEGMIFWLFIPFITFFDSRFPYMKRMKHFIMLQSAIIFISLTSFIYLYLHPTFPLDLERIMQVFAQFKSGLSQAFSQFQLLKANMVHYVLPEESLRDSNSLLFLTLFFAYFSNVISNLSIIFTLLVLYAFIVRATLWTRYSSIVIYFYLIINFIITILFFGEHLFLSKRYLIALSLVLMLWVPYALNKLQRKSSKKNYKLFYYASLFFMVVSSLGGIFDFGYSKQYIADAGHWISNNIPASSKLYSNDVQLMYYSKHYGLNVFKTRADLRQWDNQLTLKSNFDYFAIRTARHDVNQDYITLSKIKKPLQTFQNKRGDKIVIFKTMR